MSRKRSVRRGIKRKRVFNQPNYFSDLYIKGSIIGSNVEQGMIIKVKERVTPDSKIVLECLDLFKEQFKDVELKEAYVFKIVVFKNNHEIDYKSSCYDSWYCWDIYKIYEFKAVQDLQKREHSIKENESAFTVLNDKGMN